MTIPIFRHPVGYDRYEELILKDIAYYNGYCWPLDDRSGSTTARDLRQVITGTITGGVTFQSTGTNIAFQQTKCAAFATNGRITLTNASLPNPNSVYSLAGWFNCTNTASATEQFIFSSTITNNSRFNVSILSNTLRTGFATNTNTFPKSGPITNGWHHFGLSKATGNSAPTLYIDGVLQTGTTAPTSSTTVATYIGCRSNAALFFNGSIQYISVFQSTLTADMILELYKVGIGG